MQFQFSFKHMEVSPQLQLYAENKIRSVVEKFVTKAIEVQLTFAVDKQDHHINCTIVGGDGFSHNVEFSCGDMYGAVDQIVDKLTSQLRRKKDKLKHHKFKDSIRKRSFEDSPDGKDEGSIDAGDIIKYEEARKKRAAI